MKESIYPESSNRITNPHRTFVRKAQKSFGHIKTSRSNKWKKIDFPPTMDIIAETNKVLEIFNLAHKYYRKGYNVSYNLSDIIKFTPASIAILAACVSSKHFTRGLNSKGNIPNNPFLAKMFRESGFFEHMDSKKRFEPPSKNRLIHKITDAKVIPNVAKNSCKSLFRKLSLKYTDELEPLYAILIEAMQNTNNHASAGKDIEYDWWLNEFEDSRNSIMHYTFLDIGVGVFESLPVKRYIVDVLKLLDIKSNLDLVDDLLAGKIKSRTRMANRGKGIPQIFDLSKDDLFQDFYILSNDIIINTKTEERSRLDSPFYGTLYYWTIPINKSHGN